MMCSVRDFLNAGLELALARWKCKLSQHGLHVGGTERCTNIRYADDMLLFAKSLEELVFMMESLVHELAHIGLQLSSSKTKIFTTQSLTTPLFGGSVWRNGASTHG